MTAPHHPDQQPYQPSIPEQPYAPPIPEQYSLPTSGPLPRLRSPEPERSRHRQPDPEQPDEPHAYPAQPYQEQAYPDPYQEQAYPDPYQPQAYPDPYQPQAYPEQPYQEQEYLADPHQPQSASAQPYRQYTDDDEEVYRRSAQWQEALARHHETPAPPAAAVPATRGRRFEALAWSALVLGIVGVVGALIVFPYHLAAVAAGAGAVLGVIALFGGRKALAGTGVVLCAAVIVFTVVAQGVAGPGLDAGPGGLAGETAAMQDVTVHDCVVVDQGNELVIAEATIEITNGTGERQSYNVAVIVNDGSGARVAEIKAIATDVAPGQSVVLSGANASGAAIERARTGPADCQVESVNRLALGG